MKRFGILSLILLVAFFASATRHSYVSNSILSSGHFVKIRVEESGLCKMTYEQLQSAGIKPEEVRVFGFGGGLLEQDFKLSKIDDLPAVPIYMEKGDDGVFGAGDFILFYTEGPVKWSYTGTRFRHQLNPYSNYGYYFLSDDAGEQVILNDIEQESETNKVAYEVSLFSDYRYHELELLNLIDKSGTSGSGREWYGEKIVANSSLSFDFYFPNLVSTSLLYVSTDVASVSTQQTEVQISAGKDTKKLVCTKNDANFSVAMSAIQTSRFTPTAQDTQTMTINYISSEPNDHIYLNYVEMTAVRRLNMTDDGLLLVSNVQHYGETRESRYHVQSTKNNTHVWNITRLDSIYSVPQWRNTNNELLFYAPNEQMQKLLVFEPHTTNTISATVMGTVVNQDLHALRDIDMVILTNPMFIAQSQELAAAHEQYDGMTVAVVTDEQVYNEFSSGTPDASAYRWMMKMLWDRAEDDANINHPRYLLLMGDGSFDNRKLLQTSAPNLLLTYQTRNSLNEINSVATDDYFAFMADTVGVNENIAFCDIAVGRFPVQTVEQAQNMVNKATNYIANRTTGNWKNQLLYLADDGDSNLHTAAADEAAELVRINHPDFVVNKLYLDAYQQETSASGEAYPQVRNKLLNMLKNGILFFDYCGHAGPLNITSERVLDANDVSSMFNQNLGFWMLATCNFGRFDERRTSAAEEAVLNPNGGALALLSSCRTVYASQNQILNDSLSKYLFATNDAGEYYMRIGDAIRVAKNTYTKKRADVNRLPYILLGDPAIKLHYPTDYEVRTTTAIDTLKALAVCHAEGAIYDKEDGELVKDFNGKVNITVYDKLQSINTMDNDQKYTSSKVKYTYLDYPNLIYKGEADVVNGTFEYDFMVPKDIRYNIGNGRVVYYAVDTIFSEEAVGYDHNLLVGGSSSSMFTDTLGPDIRVYLNNPAFENGGKVNNKPHFYAELYDVYGINTTGSGIGHDLRLIIDDDPKQAYILNDYYQAELGNYRAGLVSYIMNELSEGHHTLSFKAWDLLNNSSTVNLDFVVSAKDEPTIITVITYPSPSTDDMTILIDHDRPDDVLYTTIYFYDVAGRLVHEKQILGSTVNFNPSDAGLSAGLYVYQVRVKTQSSEYATHAGKFLVK